MIAEHLEIELAAVIGIYFLWRKDKIVYIGQSTNIHARIAQHRKEGRKTFDKITYVECAKEELGETERRFIKKHKPFYNVSQNEETQLKPSEIKVAASFDLFRLSKSKRIVDLCPNTLRKYHAEGLNFYGQGRSVFVSKSELESFIKSRRT